MEQSPKPKTLVHQDLFARVYHKKYGEYRYRSPRYGYKKAFKYDRMVIIYLMKGDYADIQNAILLETKGFKYTTLNDIKEYLVSYIQSPRYKIAKRKLQT